MHKIYIAIYTCFIVLLAACSKDSERAALPNGSISIQLNANKDTIAMPLSVAKDSTFVIGLKAALEGTTSASDHWVNFAVDSTKIGDYRARYGAAVLLPRTAYLFYKSMTRLPAGASLSDSAQLNIILQTKLEGYTTYVLPVVIQSVDGAVDGAATSQVLYLVFKTGKPVSISKVGWTLTGFSSVNGTFVATNVLDDNNTTTYWTSNIAQKMPQWVAINFNKDVIFSAVNYYLPTALGYPANGGYPTSIQIETSMNGTTWEDRGVFAGNIANNMQTLNTGLITARYLRFTVLASVKYAATYDAIFISGIGLVP